MVRRYCCGSSNFVTKTNLEAAKLTDIAFAILRIIQLGYASHALVTFNDALEINDAEIDPNITDRAKILLEVNVGLAAGFVLVDLGLFIGVIKRFTCMLWFWLVVNALSIICTLIITILFFSVTTVVYIITAVFSIVITIWAMLAVWGSIQEIQEET